MLRWIAPSSVRVEASSSFSPSAACVSRASLACSSAASMFDIRHSATASWYRAVACSPGRRSWLAIASARRASARAAG